MDEQTRMARFESMRKMPGRQRFSRNKKLFIKHKELDKLCASEIKRHEFDTKVATVDIKQQQLLLAKQQQRLHAEQHRCAVSKEKTQLFLRSQDQKHDSQRQRNERALQSVRTEEIHKAVQELHMPLHMQKKLLTYRVE